MKNRIYKSPKKFFFTVINICAAIFSFSCRMPAGISQTPLDKPENVRVENITEDSVIIIWNSVEHARDYEVIVQKRRNGLKYFYYPENPKIELKNLDWDESYDVEIIPHTSETVWELYKTGDSSKISFTTKMPGVPEGELKRPENVKAVFNQNEKTVTVTWDKVDGAVFYEIKCEYADNLETVSDWKTSMLNAPKTTFIDKIESDMSDFTKIIYRVCARNQKDDNVHYWSKKCEVSIK